MVRLQNKDGCNQDQRNLYHSNDEVHPDQGEGVGLLREEFGHDEQVDADCQ